jgi:hypothetical protein
VKALKGALEQFDDSVLSGHRDGERMTTMTRVSAWISGLLVVMFALVTGAVAQIPTTDTTTRVLSSGFGDAVDQDVARVRDATVRFKTSAAAEAAGYKRVTDCVEHEPAGAWVTTFRTMTCSIRRSTLPIRRYSCTRRSPTARSN